MSVVCARDEQICRHDRFDGRVRGVLPDSGSGEEADESGDEEYGVWRVLVRGFRGSGVATSFR